MSVASHNLFTTFRSSRLIPFLKNPNLSPSLYSQNLHFRTQSPKILFSFASKIQTFTLRAYQSDETIDPLSNGGFNVDDFLSVAELLCIVSSAVVVVSYAVNCAVASSKRSLLGVLGSGKAFGWGVVALVSGVVIGGWIRRRQWRRICGEVVRDGRRESVNLVERVEKLEEDLRSSATIIRVLSRHLEKLGIRFRVTRKSLKEPIAQAAALAQKNSEATRALAMQEDLLEKELVEIQKVLLAMQEQQQKQLELILAISKSGKLWESRSRSNQENDVIEKSGLTEGVKQLEIQETQSSGTSKGNNNDRP